MFKTTKIKFRASFKLLLLFGVVMSVLFLLQQSLWTAILFANCCTFYALWSISPVISAFDLYVCCVPIMKTFCLIATCMSGPVFLLLQSNATVRGCSAVVWPQLWWQADNKHTGKSSNTRRDDFRCHKNNAINDYSSIKCVTQEMVTQNNT